MIRTALIFFAIYIFSSCIQDYGKLEFVDSLPSIMQEVSGVEIIPGENLIWMINDSGNAPKVYGYDITSQKIDKEIVVPNVTNRDWEDLASDSRGNLYIGDFGNNANARKDLVIYTISNFPSVQGNDISALSTSFYYEDQLLFPPKKANRNFDVEAFIFMNDYFYLFSRNRSSSFDGITKLYKIPARPGHFEAKLVGSYKTCNKSSTCQITGAAIDRASGKIALLSSNKVWIFSDYDNDKFFNGKVKKIKLGHKSQKEGITFKDSTTLYISDERNKNSGRNLYRLNVK